MTGDGEARLETSAVVLARHSLKILLRERVVTMDGPTVAAPCRTVGPPAPRLGRHSRNASTAEARRSIAAATAWIAFTCASKRRAAACSGSPTLSAMDSNSSEVARYSSACTVVSPSGVSSRGTLALTVSHSHVLRHYSSSEPMPDAGAERTRYRDRG